MPGHLGPYYGHFKEGDQLKDEEDTQKHFKIINARIKDQRRLGIYLIY